MSPADVHPTAAPVEFDLVIPAHNEERYLERCIDGLAPIVCRMPCRTRVTIVDSGSTDSTWSIAQRLSDEHDWVRALREAQPGRGRALRTAWTASDALYVGYSDVDLSGDPSSLPGMLELLTDGRADVVIGSRLADGSRVTRELDREVLSRGYSELLQWMAAPPFLDAQCGLKVMRADVCRRVLASVEDEHWFFDTELLLLAWRAGARIEEAPISWIERRDSRVHVPGTVLGDLRGLVRMSRARWAGVEPPALGARHEIDDDASRAIARELAALGGWLLAVALVFGPPRSRRRWMAATTVAGAVRPWALTPRRTATPLVNFAMLLVGVGGCALVEDPQRRGRRLIALAAATRVCVSLLRIASLRMWVTTDRDGAVAASSPPGRSSLLGGPSRGADDGSSRAGVGRPDPDPARGSVADLDSM